MSDQADRTAADRKQTEHLVKHSVRDEGRPRRRRMERGQPRSPPTNQGPPTGRVANSAPIPRPPTYLHEHGRAWLACRVVVAALFRADPYGPTPARASSSPSKRERRSWGNSLSGLGDRCSPNLHSVPARRSPQSHTSCPGLRRGGRPRLVNGPQQATRPTHHREVPAWTGRVQDSRCTERNPDETAKHAKKVPLTCSVGGGTPRSPSWRHFREVRPFRYHDALQADSALDTEQPLCAWLVLRVVLPRSETSLPDGAAAESGRCRRKDLQPAAAGGSKLSRR